MNQRHNNAIPSLPLVGWVESSEPTIASQRGSVKPARVQTIDSNTAPSPRLKIPPRTFGGFRPIGLHPPYHADQKRLR